MRAMVSSGGAAPPALDELLAGVCPYLLDAGGSWRAARPSRQHRCTAVEPPIPLAAEKQRRLCLVAEHATCQTFQAARTLRGAAAGGAAEAGAAAPVRPLVARTLPLVLEPPARGPLGLSGIAARASQLALVALMAVAAVALILARFAGGGPTAVASPSPPPSPTSAVASPSPGPTATPSPVPSPSPAPTATPSPTATPTPEPSYRTYTVQSGDTLWAIAVRFGVSVKALAELNGITDPALIHAGQVLKIPPPS